MTSELVNKNALDVSQVFQTYITLGGDVERTAIVLNLDLITVKALATSENWEAKAAGWRKAGDGELKDTQIQFNRAVNYVQSHRLRSIVDAITTQLALKRPEELIDLLTKTSKNGSEFSARPLADLVKAAETCQAMTQRALGDTVAERPESDGDKPGSRMAILVMNAMNAADKLGLDSAAVVREQLAPPPKPLSDGNAK
jgi:hypothetical protein